MIDLSSRKIAPTLTPTVEGTESGPLFRREAKIEQSSYEGKRLSVVCRQASSTDAT